MFDPKKESTIVQKAFQIASKVHEKQLRRNTNAPYIEHPLAVMEIAEKISRILYNDADIKHFKTFLDEIKIVAILHDTVEDAEENYKKGKLLKKDIIRMKDIEKKFGKDIKKYVDNLTKKDGEEYDEAIERASMDIVSLIVKIADNTHNASTLRQNDPIEKHKRRTYLISRRYLLSKIGLTPEDLGE